MGRRELMRVFSDTTCTLGEGPMWHPERNQLFWFDILGKQLYFKGIDGPQQAWGFDEYISAAGWVDADTLIMASASALWRLDIATGARDRLVALETDNPVTRSNDGRADPQGGFWIGTMGVDAEPGAGAIYRYYRGEVRKLFADITISNAICFAPDGQAAYFTDTVTKVIHKMALDADGWPKGAPEVFVDLNADGLNPDGAVVDADGMLWNAQWGASRVAGYAPDGTLQQTVDVPASQASCPAFGGADGTTLFVTTAAVGLEEAQGGMTFTTKLDVQGQREHQVIL